MKKNLVYLFFASMMVFICWVLYKSRPAKIMWKMPYRKIPVIISLTNMDGEKSELHSSIKVIEDFEPSLKVISKPV